MIEFAKFSTENAEKDEAVGIAIRQLIGSADLNAYATFIAAGKKVGCHGHGNGDEWYIILSGEGEIWTGDIISGTVNDIKSETFTKGCIFCIHQNTAHQLKARSDVELIFLCPDAHLTHDRVGFNDLCQ
ncbi:hypothetical protein BTJ39_09355 [Izhakiella australiensis]|uniref:Cupin type-2 domain-containing protein n=1 Tax=Izhakiella australiensis TaxID=1926881 RepID=A0A1S8YML5_9GAMM|nr:cupin domain-containing protein [Izhakiella australiensis]OON40095.1 hypothetical protein BTJ39_09355 [Izhakiella australiensis]